MILESRRYVVLAGYRRRSLLPAPCDAYLIIIDSPSKRNIMVALHHRLRSADPMLTRQWDFDMTDEHNIAKQMLQFRTGLTDVE